MYKSHIRTWIYFLPTKNNVCYRFFIYFMRSTISVTSFLQEYSHSTQFVRCISLFTIIKYRIGLEQIFHSRFVITNTHLRTDITIVRRFYGQYYKRTHIYTHTFSLLFALKYTLFFILFVQPFLEHSVQHSEHCCMPIGLQRITRGKVNDRWNSSRLRIVASFVIGYYIR